MKKFKAIVENLHKGNGFGQHIIVPEDVSSYFIKQKIKRVICTINQKHPFHCALNSRGDGSYLIMIPTKLRDEIKLPIGRKIAIKIEQDDSPYGMPMPEEMAELLLIDDEANQLFHALTPGMQRSLLHVISKPKNSDIRINKALAIAQYLKTSKGKVDRKQSSSKHSCSAKASSSTYGHTGFTGASVWIDPVHDLVFIFLPNRIYPDIDNRRIYKSGVRKRIHTVVYDALDTYEAPAFKTKKESTIKQAKVDL